MESEAWEVKAGRLLVSTGLTVAVAESCTGGLVCSRFTDVSGSSAYVVGGVVAYVNRVKQQLLGVDGEVLERRGPVSRPVAVQMAHGVRRLLGADLGLGLTGLAGPTGGTPDKPVGLVYVALAADDGDWCERHVWAGDRCTNKQSSSDAALKLLCDYLEARCR